MTWSADGIAYFNKVAKAWTDAFRANSRANTVLTIVWKKWIEDEGKTFKVGGSQAMKKKAIHSILRTRTAGEKSKGGAKGQPDVETIEEEFCYESGAEDNGIIDVGEWTAAKKRPKPKVMLTVDTESDDDDNDDDEEDDDNDDDNHEDNDDDEGAVGGGGNGEDEEKEAVNDNADDDDEEEEEDERSLNGIQQLMEDEAIASGIS